MIKSFLNSKKSSFPNNANNKHQQKYADYQSFSSPLSNKPKYSISSNIGPTNSLRVTFSPKVKITPPRKPRNRWLDSLSEEERRTLNRNQKLVGSYKQSVLKRYGLSKKASNTEISRSCIPRKVLILINQASRNTKTLFRKSTILTELESIIASDIKTKNTELSEKYTEKLINQYGSIEQIPEGERDKILQTISSWKNNGENLIPIDVLNLDSLTDIPDFEYSSD